MGRRLGIGGPAAALVAILSWRLVAEVLERRRALAATGELDRRVAARRSAAIDGAARAAAPTVTPVVQGETTAAHPGHMDRALAMSAREREAEPSAASNSWIWSALLALSIMGAVAGTVLTTLALIDPLAEASLLRAGLGLVAVLAGWFGARASSRRRDV